MSFRFIYFLHEQETHHFTPKNKSEMQSFTSWYSPASHTFDGFCLWLLVSCSFPFKNQWKCFVRKGWCIHRSRNYHWLCFEKNSTCMIITYINRNRKKECRNKPSEYTYVLQDLFPLKQLDVNFEGSITAQQKQHWNGTILS